MASIEVHLEEISILDEPPLWSSVFSTRCLDMKEYRARFPVESSMWLPPPREAEIGIQATKSSGDVIMEPLALVRSLMHTEEWKGLFPCIIVDAAMLNPGQLTAPEIHEDTVSQQIEIRAEIQPLSPLAAVRELVFRRTCYRLEDETWLVVDLPVPFVNIGEGYNSRPQLPYVRSCLVRPSSTQGLSNVVWIEMSQFRIPEVHPWYLSLIGGVFSSERWLTTLSRECSRRVRYSHVYLPGVLVRSDQAAPLKQLVMMADEMTTRFYSSLSSTTPRSTIKPDAHQHVSFSMDGPYWIAAKSALFEVSASQLFDLVCSLDSLGGALLQFPITQKRNRNRISLHLCTDGKKVVRETCFNNSAGILVTATLDTNSNNNEDDVTSAINSVRALSIDSHYTNSFITVTYVVQPASSSPQIQQNWMKDFSKKLCNIIRDVGKQTNMSVSEPFGK